MSQDQTYLEEFTERIKDRYTAEELVEILGLSVEDIVEVYFEECMENRLLQKELGIQDFDDE